MSGHDIEVPQQLSIIGIGGVTPIEGLSQLTMYRTPYETLGRAAIRRLQELDELVNQRNRELEYAATHDPLTGLLNRAGLARRIAGLIELADNCDFTVLYFDLDRFKLINDSLGHSAGDEVLVEVTARLNELLADLTAQAREGEIDPIRGRSRPGQVGRLGYFTHGSP